MMRKQTGRRTDRWWENDDEKTVRQTDRQTDKQTDR